MIRCVSSRGIISAPRACTAPGSTQPACPRLAPTNIRPSPTAGWIKLASSPTKQFFTASDGINLAWYELGKGRPVVLLHGFFSHAETNWLKFGHAQVLAAAGFRVIMPDLRGHGQSDAPHEARFYPPDALARAALQLTAPLGLADYDLGGYSLGGRTAARMAILGDRKSVVQGKGVG